MIARLSMVSLFALAASCSQPRLPFDSSIVPPLDPQIDMRAQQATSASDSAAPDISQYWMVFDDPVLVRLEEEVLNSNFDLSAAAARVRQAGAMLSTERASRLPTLAASISNNPNQVVGGGFSSNYNVSASASWEIDLFGKLKNGRRAAEADLAAAGYNQANVQRALAAELARNYVQYRGLDIRVELARSALDSQAKSLKAIEFRVKSGLSPGVDLQRGRFQYAQVQRTIPQLVQAQAEARNRISLLAGHAPGWADDLLDQRSGIPVLSQGIRFPAPADLLRRRPDVLLSEAQLVAQAARIGVAKASLLPSLTLGGALDLTAQSISSLGSNIVSSFFVSLSQTLFDNGRRRGLVRAQRAATEEALARHRAAILAALEDVDNANTGMINAADQMAADQAALNATNVSLVDARKQYQSGFLDANSFLEIERSTLVARDNLAVSQMEQANSAVRLYLAMGGGWSTRSDQSPGN